MLNRTTRLLSLTTAIAFAGTTLSVAAPSEELIAAAKAEGQLTTIALPHDWCGYGEIIKSFKDKYGIQVNELNPDAGSGDEIEAIKANKDNKGPQAPDVIDVGFTFGTTAKKTACSSLIKYRHGIRSLMMPKMLKVIGTATITAYWLSK